MRDGRHGLSFPCWRPAAATVAAVHTIWMIGTLDSQFPWAGTPGPILSQLSGPDFQAAMIFRNGCAPEPVETAIEDIDPTDNTTGTKFEFQGCNRSFVHYRFERMDHNWPGSPFVLVGNPNRDISASGVIARFFLANPR